MGMLRTIAITILLMAAGAALPSSARAWYWDVGPYGVYYSYPRYGYAYPGVPYYQRGGPPYYQGYGPPYTNGYGAPYMMPGGGVRYLAY
jgi:hypothetical protein